MICRAGILTKALLDFHTAAKPGLSTQCGQQCLFQAHFVAADKKVREDKESTKKNPFGYINHIMHETQKHIS